MAAFKVFPPVYPGPITDRESLLQALNSLSDNAKHWTAEQVSIFAQEIASKVSPFELVSHDFKRQADEALELCAQMSRMRSPLNADNDDNASTLYTAMQTAGLILDPAYVMLETCEECGGGSVEEGKPCPDCEPDEARQETDAGIEALQMPDAKDEASK